MKVKSDDNKIVLTDLPIVQWLFGLVFSGAGLQILLPSLFSASGFSIFGALFGAVFVFAGYQAGLSAVYQKITIDRWLKKVVVKKIGLRHFGKTEYPADDIENFYSETETDSENSNSHTICISLKGGQSLVLGTAFRSKAECEAVIKTARTFLEQIDFSGKFQPSIFNSSAEKVLPKRYRHK